MGIAEQPLHAVAEIEAARARDVHQDVDRLEAHAHREEGVAPVAHLVVVRPLGARSRHRHGMLADTAHQYLGGIDARARLGDLELDGLARPDRQAGRGGVAPARRADRGLVGAFRAAQHDAGQHVGTERQQRQTEQRLRVDAGAEVRLAVHRPRRDGAVVGHEQIPDRDVLRTGAGQPDRVPGVDDLVLRAVDDGEALVDRRAVVLLAHHEGQHVPVGIVDARRQWPAAVDLVAALDLAAATRREGERGGDQRVDRLAPDLLLDARIPVGQHPVMAGEIADVPGGRRADAGDFGADVDEDADIELGAADAGRLAHAKQAGGMQVALGLVGHAAQLLAGLGPFGEPRHQGAGTLEHFLVAHAGERDGLAGQGRRRRPVDR